MPVAARVEPRHTLDGGSLPLVEGVMPLAQKRLTKVGQSLDHAARNMSIRRESALWPKRFLGECRHAA